ncbi:hypothetical protein QQF64_005284, partial [Cirrhinus molitorella]
MKSECAYERERERERETPSVSFFEPLQSCRYMHPYEKPQRQKEPLFSCLHLSIRCAARCESRRCDVELSAVLNPSASVPQRHSSTRMRDPRRTFTSRLRGKDEEGFHAHAAAHIELFRSVVCLGCPSKEGKAMNQDVNRLLAAASVRSLMLLEARVTGATQREDEEREKTKAQAELI